MGWRGSTTRNYRELCRGREAVRVIIARFGRQLERSRLLFLPCPLAGQFCSAHSRIRIVILFKTILSILVVLVVVLVLVARPESYSCTYPTKTSAYLVKFACTIAKQDRSSEKNGQQQWRIPKCYALQRRANRCSSRRRSRRGGSIKLDLKQQRNQSVPLHHTMTRPDPSRVDS